MEPSQFPDATTVLVLVIIMTAGGLLSLAVADGRKGNNRNYLEWPEYALAGAMFAIVSFLIIVGFINFPKETAILMGTPVILALAVAIGRAIGRWSSK